MDRGRETYLNLGIAELAADQALGVEDGVVRVHGDLVLGGISDQTLGVGECHERGSCAVTLVVGDDITTGNTLVTICNTDALKHCVNLPILAEDTHARVRGTQIDTDSGSHLVCVKGKRLERKWKKKRMVFASSVNVFEVLGVFVDDDRERKEEVQELRGKA
jgi:hypothetical protein